MNLSDFSVTWAYTRVALVCGDLGGLIRGGGLIPGVLRKCLMTLRSDDLN